MKFILRLFQRRAAPPVNDIWNEIERRKLGFTAFCSTYSMREYVISLSFKQDDIDCKVDGRGRTFDEALANAWEKWPRT